MPGCSGDFENISDWSDSPYHLCGTGLLERSSQAPDPDIDSPAFDFIQRLAGQPDKVFA
jgi:hypothetical protein